MAIAHSVAQATSRTPDLAAIRADLEATRTGYSRLVAELTDADLARPCAISKWTIKEVVTHLVVALEQATPMMVSQARKRKPMPKLLDTRFGHWMNYQMARRAARKATRESLVQRYDAAMARLQTLLDGVRADEWELPTAYPDGRPLTMATVFHTPADHLALHAAWVRQTLGR